ncbi:MAG: hypothetical protein ACYCOR_05280 [Acidobacteriaceae bacterium]
MREIYESDFYLGRQRVRQIHNTRTEAAEVERQGKALDLARRIEKWTPEQRSILDLKSHRQGDAQILENMLLAIETVPPSSDKDVLLAIIWCAKGDGTGAVVSMKRLELDSRHAQTTVKAARTRLKDKGFISYEHGYGATITQYTVHLDRLAQQRPNPTIQGNGARRDLLAAGASACGITVGAYIEDILAKHVQKNVYINAPNSATEELRGFPTKRGHKPAIQ